MPALRAFVGRTLLPLAVGTVSGPAHAYPVINEILPDPPGTDAGHEFVEFLNAGVEAFAMEGVEFQFANGADGPLWRTRWTAPAGLVLAPGERFLLVDRLWADLPAGDGEATLGLQNGPDAVRLVRQDEVLDLVGYGALTDPAMSEGAPAALQPGRALARRPDGSDTGDNGADFVAAEPTPGRPNFRPWSARTEGIVLEPPSLLRPGDAVTVCAVLVNDGLRDWPACDVVLAAAGEAATVRVGALAAGSGRPVAWVLRPWTPGPADLVVRLRPAAGADTLRLDLGRLQVGPGDLLLNEVLASPGAGQGEWFEIRVAGSAPIDLGSWAVREEDGDWRPLPPRTLSGHSLAVIAQDSAGLVGWLDEVQARGGAAGCGCADPRAGVVPLSGWGTLNNDAPAGRPFADRLRLRDPAGTTVDHVVIGAPGGPDLPGRSLERTSPGPMHPTGAPWTVCTAGPGSTPGCPNSATLPDGPPGAGLRLVPAVLDPGAGAGGLHAVFVLPASATGWRLRVYDLWGVPVRDFGGDALGPGPRDLFWNGRDDAGRPVPPGGYVFVLETAGAGARPGRERRLCAVR